MIENPDFIAWHYWEHDSAVRGMHPLALGIYQFALLRYLCERCAGLRDDDFYLRAICNGTMLSDSDWDSVRPVVFGPVFKLEDGLWHQKRARLEWDKAFEMIKALRDKSSVAGKASWEARKKKGVPMPKRMNKTEPVHKDNQSEPVHKPFIGPPPRK